VAIDIDPDAIEVAHEVLGANSLSESIELKLGSLQAAGERSWDGIVANISGYFTPAAAEDLASMLEPRGRLVASGFSPGEAGMVERNLRRAGLRLSANEEMEDWAALAAIKRSGAA
jgi:ribosomal protein L11 methylase PrmA